MRPVVDVVEPLAGTELPMGRVLGQTRNSLWIIPGIVVHVCNLSPWMM